jgi:hypothetical protein
VHWIVRQAGGVRRCASRGPSEGSYEDQLVFAHFWPAAGTTEPHGLASGDAAELAESWFDIQDAIPEELRKFLTPLDLHPFQLARCLDSVDDPGVVAFGKSVLMEYPAAFDQRSADRAYLTILLKAPVLVTARHGPMPALDELLQI